MDVCINNQKCNLDSNLMIDTAIQNIEFKFENLAQQKIVMPY